MLNNSPLYVVLICVYYTHVVLFYWILFVCVLYTWDSYFNFKFWDLCYNFEILDMCREFGTYILRCWICVVSLGTGLRCWVRVVLDLCRVGSISFSVLR